MIRRAAAAIVREARHYVLDNPSAGGVVVLVPLWCLSALLEARP